jgi:hypothetical protein
MMSLGNFGYEKYGRINLSIKVISNRGIKTGRWNEDLSVPGMLLSDSFEPDLSHTSILYYEDITEHEGI